MDRCATDAIQAVTGCSLGKRSLKFLDYGKMATTFLNLGTEQGGEDRRTGRLPNQGKEYFPEISDKYEAQIEAYKFMTDEQPFTVMEVTVNVATQDMPGRPLRRVQCNVCGEDVQDMREVYRDGKALLPCAAGGYYDAKTLF